jgi:hypothetical protein
MYKERQLCYYMKKPLLQLCVNFVYKILNDA